MRCKTRHPSVVAIGCFCAVLLLCGSEGWCEQGAEQGNATGATYPGKHWQKVERPEQLGWSSDKLDEAKKFSQTIATHAVFIAHHGRVVAEWGETTKRLNVHSIRKSFMSALYGIYVAEGKIHLADTMKKLGIDDNPPKLTALEKQATVLDLLKARSGVYHPALYETESMKKRRPPRWSHAPSSFWYYNNWDFNVLGTIFRQYTGLTVHEALEQRIARPIEMEDYRLQDGEWFRGKDSIHPAYPIWLSARDMARFGLLFARGGKWRGQQIVPADWVAESTTSYSPAIDLEGRLYCGYGYMWWTEIEGRHLDPAPLPRGTFSARGAGGHYILVVPAWDLVIVHRVDNDRDEDGGPKVERKDFGKLVDLIVAAMPEAERRRTGPPAASLPQQLDDLVPPLMKEFKVPGVSIVGIENRRIAWERQYGVRCVGKPERVDTQTLFEACSMSKPPAAYVALKLVEQGKLDLDRPLSEYLDKPYLPNEPLHRKITARMVLSHISGLPNWREGGWRSNGPVKVLFEPGTRYGYSGEGFLYLQRVIEHITGEPFDTYIRRTLLAPLGIIDAGYVWRAEFEKHAAAGHDDNGHVKPDRRLFEAANAACSLYCTPADYGLFLMEMLKPDRSAAQSLSIASLRAMLTRTSEIKDAPQVVRREGPPAYPSCYGLGWVIDATQSGDRISHGGTNGTGFRCFCEFDVMRGSGIVIMTNGLGGEKLWRRVIATISDP
jgi:CubicO group peptidase (beta-lactamase class C family)